MSTNHRWSFQDEGAGIQHLPVYGLPAHMLRVRHGLLRVADADAVRQWLAALLDGRGALHEGAEQGGLETVPVRPMRGGRRPAGQHAVNLGLSFAGLQALGLPTDWAAALRERAPAFAAGAVQRAAARLGDTGDSAAWRWEPAFRSEQAHLLLSLHARTGAQIESQWQALRSLPGAQGLDGWDAVHDGRHLVGPGGARLVHFGYEDGIANPRFEGVHQASQVPGSPALHAPGELLLGHANNDGANPWGPSGLGALPGAAAFFRDASFGVLRKIAQDEAGFRDYVAQAAARLGESTDWVLAKLCGRWPGGRLMRPADAPPDALRDAPRFDAFHFQQEDAHGAGCPFGAHIRRLNPRGDALVQPQRRPLVRRGVPYGPRFAQRTASAERGLLGLFFCASLEDQFEHLLGAWADRNPMGPDHRGTAKDPLIGQHDDPQAWFEIPGAPGRPPRRLPAPQRPFTTTRGTAYLLYLSEPALRRVAAGWG